MPEPALCRCGHYDREHDHDHVHSIAWCSGNTWAYPDDAERDGDGIEVPCMCSGFDAAGREADR